MRIASRRGTMALVLVALLALAAAVLVVSRSSSRWIGWPFPSGDGGPAVPAEGAYLGASVSPAHATQQGRIEAMHSFESSISATPSIAHVYVQWQTRLATTSTLRFVEDGQRLLVSWALADTQQIVSGRDDSQITDMARQIKALDVPIFLEPRWEMDRPNLAGEVHSPKDFIAAWKHLRVLFWAEAVHTVSWVWCPTAAGFATGRAQTYYPGNALVDWVCADAYPQKASRSATYEPFADLVGPFLTWAAHTGKPVMIGEFGVPRTYGNRRAAWLIAAATFVRTHQQIKALVYFNGPIEPTRPSGDFALQGDTAALSAFATIAASQYFHGVQR